MSTTSRSASTIPRATRFWEAAPRPIADRLTDFWRLGFTAFNVVVVGPERDQQIERLARQVVATMR